MFPDVKPATVPWGIFDSRRNSYYTRESNDAWEEAILLGVSFAQWQNLETRHMPRTSASAEELRREFQQLTGDRCAEGHSTPSHWLWRQKRRDYREVYLEYLSKVPEHTERMQAYHQAMDLFSSRVARGEINVKRPKRPRALEEPDIEDYV